MFHPFLWDSGTLTDLGTLGGSDGIANVLNDAGDVAGLATLAGDEVHHAFFWRKGVMNDLGTIGNDPCSVAHGINANGLVVGTSTDCFGTELHGFLWEPGKLMIDLNSFVPPASDLVVVDGETINDRGEITGDGLLPNGDFHAILLVPCGSDVSEDDGCLDGTAIAANGSGQAAQRGEQRQSPTKPFMWRQKLFGPRSRMY